MVKYILLLDNNFDLIKYFDFIFNNITFSVVNTIVKINFSFLFFLFCLFLEAQKIGYVDTKYLLNNNQEYITSKKYVKKEIEDWNAELKKMKSDYEEEKSKFLNEKILLTKEQIAETEKKLEEDKKKIIKFETDKFGPEGELIRSQLTIINPIQNKIWTTVQTISKRRGLTMVFDKGSDTGMTIIYSDPRYDLTQAVLDYMNNPKNFKEKKEVDPNAPIIEGLDVDLDDELRDKSKPKKKPKEKGEKDGVDKTKEKIDKTIDKINNPVKTLSDKIKEMQKNKNK